MAIVLVVPDAGKVLELQSGQKYKIPAEANGPGNSWERRLIWSQKEGLIDQNGVFSAPITKMDMNYTVEVRRSSDLVTAPVVVHVLVKKAEEKPSDRQPTEIEIREHGKKGKYRLSCQVFDQNKKGVKSTIVFYDNSSKKSILPGNKCRVMLATGNNGWLDVNLSPFKDSVRRIQIEVVGMAKNNIISLAGPKEKRCPRCHSKRWDGKTCKHCSYPKPRVTR
jgi:hypothetical protein